MKGRSNNYYSSIVELMYYTSIKPISLDPEGNMTELVFISRIEDYLKEASDYINVYTKRNFHKEVLSNKLEEIPEGIHGICRRIVSDIIVQLIARRDDQIVSLGDFISVLQDSIFNKNIRESLDMYVRIKRPSFFIVGSDVPYKRVGLGRNDSVISYGGNHIDIVCSEDLTKGSFVNIYTYDGIKVRLADSLIGRSASGFVQDTFLSGEVARVYLSGLIEYSENLSVGVDYVLGVGGSLKRSVQIGDKIIQRVGYSISGNLLKVSFGDVVRSD